MGGLSESNDGSTGILAEAARRLPDPRTEKAVTHTTEDILTQQVYQTSSATRTAMTRNFCETIRSSKRSSEKILAWKTNRSPADQRSIDFSTPSLGEKQRSRPMNGTSSSKCDALRLNALMLSMIF